jgi:hypothetical protein
MQAELRIILKYLKHQELGGMHKCTKSSLRKHLRLSKRELERRIKLLSKQGLIHILLVLEGVPSVRSIQIGEDQIAFNLSSKGRRMLESEGARRTWFSRFLSRHTSNGLVRSLVGFLTPLIKVGVTTAFLLGASNSHAQCPHTISLLDSYGDGWNGGSVTVSVNGTPVLTNITLANGAGPQDFTFSASDGDAISVTYAAGSWAGENYFDLTDGIGNVLADDYYPNTSGTWSGTGACTGTVSGCTDPLAINYNPSATVDDGSCYYGVPQSGNNSYTTCGATLYDAGGPSADYQNNANGQTTLTPATAGQVIALNFTSFNLETNWDFLYVYDGNSTAAPQVAGSPFTGTALPANITSTAAGGELTLVFTSDGSATRPGFEIQVSCVAPSTSGCTDPLALNYNASATTDDGSCFYGIPATGSNAYTTCGITLYDHAGPTANYQNNANGTTVLTPSSAGQAIQLNFVAFDLENNFDFLYVYNGNSTAAPQVVGSPFTGTALPPNIASTATGGELTLVFTSDGSTTRPGFEIAVNCVPLVIPGCMDPLAANYNPAATVDDGSCVYPPSNDDCANAQIISVACTSPSTISGTTGFASEETGMADPTCDPGTIHDVWYSFNSDLYTSVNLTATLGTATWLGAEIHTTCGTPATGLTIGGNPGNCDFNVSAPSPTVISGLTPNTDYRIRLFTNADFDTPGTFTFTLTTDGPNVDAGSDQMVCTGDQVTLSASGALSYTWDNGVSNNTPFSAPASTTTYTVIGTDANGCSNNDQVTVTVNQPPTVNAGNDTAICLGGNALLNGTVSGGQAAIYNLTTSGGSFAGEKWVNITTGVDGSGTVVWAQGNGTIGNSSGLLTNQPIDLTVYAGQTLYLNTYDQYDDGWDGTVYELSLNGTVVINNSGNSPNDGADTDASFTWEATQEELETSEAFTVPSGMLLSWTPAATLSDASILNPVASPTSTTTYTLTATANGCSASDDMVVTVDQPSSAATAISGAGNLCLGTTATLSVQGGALAGTSDWEWYEGSCNGTAIGTGPTITVTPSASTTYFVTATANGTCPATPCTSGTVTLPTPSNNLSGDGVTATCPVNQNGFVHLLASNGDLVASINANGQNLGSVTATSYIEAAPLLVEACNHPGNITMMTSVLDRHWVITTEFQPTNPVEVLLPFTDSELSSLTVASQGNQNTSDNLNTIADLGATKYSGTNEDNLFPNNCIANGGSGNFEWKPQATNGQVNTLLTGHQATNRYITVDVNSFSEFWLHATTDESALPVELISFSANCTDNGEIKIHWSTASESQSSHFTLERSHNTEDWTFIDIIPAAGNSQNLINYTTVDIPEERTIAYYRLRQFDSDGTEREKWLTSSECTLESPNALLVYPNPAHNQVQITLSSTATDKHATIYVKDLEGRNLMEQHAPIHPGNNTFLLNINTLPSGVYFITIGSELLEINSERVVKLNE